MLTVMRRRPDNLAVPHEMVALNMLTTTGKSVHQLALVQRSTCVNPYWSWPVRVNTRAYLNGTRSLKSVCAIDFGHLLRSQLHNRKMSLLWMHTYHPSKAWTTVVHRKHRLIVLKEWWRKSVHVSFVVFNAFHTNGVFHNKLLAVNPGWSIVCI